NETKPSISILIPTAILLFGAMACNSQVSKCKVGGCEANTQVINSNNLKHQMNNVNKHTDITCKLTSQELQKRKEEVIASLKIKVLDKKELKDGYSFKFEGTE